jgi:hypothetical protein
MSTWMRMRRKRRRGRIRLTRRRRSSAMDIISIAPMALTDAGGGGMR